MGNKIQLTKIIFISVFTIIAIGVEFAYRHPLFDKSVDIAISIQNTFDFSIGFFQIYTWIGVIDAYFYIPLVFLLFPISYSYTFFITSMLSTHFCNYAKLIYGEGRPYLLTDKEEFLKTKAEKGYGNPSGHSFQSTIIFLGLSQILIDYFKLGKINCAILYAISAFLIYLINFSRVILGVHSINQVIFGDCLGFILYFIIYKIFQPHLKEPIIFFEKFVKAKFHIINSIFLVISFIYVIVGANICDKQKDYQELKKKVIERLGINEDGQLTILTPNSIAKCLNIMAYIGANCGISILVQYTKTRLGSKFDKLNNYNRNTEKPWYICLLIRALALLISYLPYLAIIFRPKGLNVYVYYIVFNALPMFLLGFVIFGPNIILILSFKFGNKDINIIDTLIDSEYQLGIGDDEEKLE